MRTRNWRLAPALVALVLGVTMAPSALAQCGFTAKVVKRSAWQPQTGGARLVRTALGRSDDREDDWPTIVGMWHVVFTANTQGGEAIPTPFVLDNAVVVWHSDGTEIMNSSRPAQDGNFCLGVWEKKGWLKYYLNHIPWQGNDPTNAPSGIGNPQGGVQLIEQINLSLDGSHYSGTFTLTPYDVTGHAGPAFTGVLAATRITTSTKITELF